MSRKYSVAGCAALAFVTIVSGGASAQNTVQAEQFRMDICKTVGMRASNAWNYRQSKEPYPMHILTASDPVRAIDLWAINFAMNEAADREEAIKVSMAKCFDNVDRVFRDARHGDQTRIEDLR